MIPLEWMPPLMFGGLVIFMLIGFPVAFSLMAAGLFFSVIAMSEGFFGMPFLSNLASYICQVILLSGLIVNSSAQPVVVLTVSKLSKNGAESKTAFELLPKTFIKFN